MESTSSDRARGERAMLRHTVATLAYRAEKVLRDVPDGFADHRLAPGVRTPLELVGHLGDLIEWATRTAQGHMIWKAECIGEWNADVARFYTALSALDPVPCLRHTARTSGWRHFSGTHRRRADPCRATGDAQKTRGCTRAARELCTGDYRRRARWTRSSRRAA